VARGDDGPGSDIDIMVEIDPQAHLTVFDYADLKDSRGRPPAQQLWLSRVCRLGLCKGSCRLDQNIAQGLAWSLPIR
jgi:hypothetical protein